MKKKFKINYKNSIVLVFILSTLGIFSVIINNLLKFIKTPNYILLPFIYSIPFILIFILIFIKNKKENIKLFFPHKKQGIKIYFLMILLIILSIIITDQIHSIIPNNNHVLEKMYNEMEKLFNKYYKNPLSLVFSIVFLAPICEEFFFRGVILNGLINNNIHPVKAILFSSFLFGIIHMNPWQFIGGMVIGSVLGLVYFCTRSVMNCILLHAINNGLASLTIFYTKSSNYKNINEYDFLKNKYILFLIPTIMIIIVGHYFIKKTKKIWN